MKKNIAHRVKNATFNENNKSVTIPNYHNTQVTVMIYKRKIEAIWKQKIISGEKETFVIEAENISDYRYYIEKKVAEIQTMCDYILESIVQNYGIKQISFPIWSRHEDWTDDSRIQQLPDDCIFYQKIMKKVYDGGVEFTGYTDDEPIEKLSQFLENSALIDFAPEFTKGLVAIKEDLLIFLNPLNYLKSRIKKPIDILLYKEIVSKLKYDELMDISNYLFKLEAFNNV